MNRNGTTVLTGTLVLSVLLSPVLRSKPSAAGHATQESASTAAAGAGKNKNIKRTLIEHHTQDEISAMAQQQYLSDLSDLVQETCNDNKNKCKVNPSDFIIALVPDPLHTHLALQFDRSIEVIEQALQDEGFSFDRAIMPWDSKGHPESEDYESRLEAEWYEQALEDCPGLMIFRGGQEHAGEWKLVLVVSETPTGGIRKRQFLSAIDQIRTASGKDLTQPASWGSKPGTDPGLRILGPTFSGSLPSLRKLLAAACDQPAGGRCFPLVSIHSGSVSSRDAILDFEKQEQPDNVHFVSFQESDEVMLERFIEFLTGDGYNPAGKDHRGYFTRNIAVLSEDETAYGGSGSRLSRAAASEGNEKRTKSKDDKKYCYTEESTKEQYCVLKLYFPREISQLRAAYQDSLSASTPTDSRAPARDTLPSNFAVPGSDDDTVTPYSAKQMPLSQESIMLGIVSELRKHQIQFVILRATDPLDMLFLSEYLRSAFSQGRIVTIGADLLFRREASDPRLHGVLALSTYSLSPSASHNFINYEQNRVERIYPSSIEAGTYNAMRSLLTAWVTDAPKPYDNACAQNDSLCRHQLSTYPDEKHQTQPLALYQYGWPYEWDHSHATTYDAPPVHLLALGRDEYWPVASLGPFPGESLVSTLPRVDRQFQGQLDPVKIPNSWRAVQLFAIALGAGFCLCLWFSSVFSKSQSLAMFAPAVRDSRTTLILVAGLSLILIMLILLWPSLHLLSQTQPKVLEWLLGVVIFGVFISTLIELWTRGRLLEGGEANAKKFWTRHRGLLPAVLFALLSILLVIRVLWGSTAENSAFVVRFAILRATQLASGLSFIMPVFFFLTAGLWWAIQVAAGCALLDDRRPRLPSGMKDIRVMGVSEESLPGLKEAYHLGGLTNVRHWAVIVAFLGGFWWLGNHSHPIMSLERPFLETAMCIFFAFAVAGMIVVTLRLWQIWLGLRTLLVGLDAIPLRSGFERLEGLSWKPIWRLGLGSLETFQRIFAREKEAMDRAMNTVPITCDEVAQEWNKTIASYTEAGQWKGCFLKGWGERRKTERKLVEQFGRFQCTIAKVAGAALDYLAWSWSVQEEEMASSTGNPGPDPKIVACERFVCSVYVSFLLVMLIRIRTLIVAIGGMYVLTLIATTQYPFEPKGAIQGMLAVLLGFVVIVVGTVFAQIHRDTTLSNITDKTPGELGLDFWLRMAGFVALPLFSFFASQFPSANGFLYSWLQPAIEALNR